MKSLPVYFYVQKNASHLGGGKVSFELTRLNIGGAMDASSGIFTVPRNGVYSFAFTSVGTFSTTRYVGLLRVALALNGIEIGNGVTVTHDNASTHTVSVHSILELNAGDKVWIIITGISPESYMDDSSSLNTHFTGHLLQENLA